MPNVIACSFCEGKTPETQPLCAFCVKVDTFNATLVDPLKPWQRVMLSKWLRKEVWTFTSTRNETVIHP